jgi:hypothetical protein
MVRAESLRPAFGESFGVIRPEAVPRSGRESDHRAEGLALTDQLRPAVYRQPFAFPEFLGDAADDQIVVKHAAAVRGRWKICSALPKKRKGRKQQLNERLLRRPVAAALRRAPFERVY